MNKSLGVGFSFQPFDWRLGFIQPKWSSFSRLLAFGPFRLAWQW